MALYRLEAKIVARGQRAGGRSVVAAAAYRAGAKLEDQRYQLTHDYSRRQPGVTHTEIMLPEDAPRWMGDRQQLWNAVEAVEKRKDAQLAREVELIIPRELDADAGRELVRGYVREQFVSRGMVADVAIHSPKAEAGNENPHAHVLLTTRELLGPVGDRKELTPGFGQKARQWNRVEVLEGWRESWAEHCNRALADAGSSARVDHRSYERQGIDRAPGVHLGPAATALERKGESTRAGQFNRVQAFRNAIMGHMRQLKDSGQVGAERLWERAGGYFSTLRDRSRELFEDESSGGGSGPQPWAQRVRQREAGPELER